MGSIFPSSSPCLPLLCFCLSSFPGLLLLGPLTPDFSQPPLLTPSSSFLAFIPSFLLWLKEGGCHRASRENLPELPVPIMMSLPALCPDTLDSPKPPELSLCSFTVHHYHCLSCLLIAFLLPWGVSSSLPWPLMGFSAGFHHTTLLPQILQHLHSLHHPPMPFLLFSLPRLLLPPLPEAAFPLPSLPPSPFHHHRCLCNLSYHQGLSIQKNK